MPRFGDARRCAWMHANSQVLRQLLRGLVVGCVWDTKTGCLCLGWGLFARLQLRPRKVTFATMLDDRAGGNHGPSDGCESTLGCPRRWSHHTRKLSDMRRTRRSCFSLSYSRTEKKTHLPHTLWLNRCVLQNSALKRLTPSPGGFRPIVKLAQVLTLQTPWQRFRPEPSISAQ